jgi:hypothetical protein
VNANVDLIVVTDFFETAVKVLHVLHEQIPGECEVSLLILVVVYYVDHD